MQFAALSVAFTGLKAISTVTQHLVKLKKLSNLPIEIEEDTFYLIHTVHSLKPSLELAILLHTRHITCNYVSSSISLARRVLVECETFLDSIDVSIDNETDNDDTDSDSDSLTDDSSDDYDGYDDNDDSNDNENSVKLTKRQQQEFEQEYAHYSPKGKDKNNKNGKNTTKNGKNNAMRNARKQAKLAKKQKKQQKMIEYLSAPAQRDRLGLLLRRLQLVCQSLNLGVSSCQFIFPLNCNIFNFPFVFNENGFNIAMQYIRYLEMNRKLNYGKRGKLLVCTGNLHLWHYPSTMRRPSTNNMNENNKQSKNDSMQDIAASMILEEQGHYKCVVSIDEITSKAYLTISSVQDDSKHETESVRGGTGVNTGSENEIEYYEDISDNNNDNDGDGDDGDDGDDKESKTIDDNDSVTSMPQANGIQTTSSNGQSYKMELSMKRFCKWKRFDGIYNNYNQSKDKCYKYKYKYKWEENLPENSLLYMWHFDNQSYVLEFETLDKLYLKNIPNVISCEVFEFIIALLLVRSDGDNNNLSCALDRQPIENVKCKVKQLLKFSLNSNDNNGANITYMNKANSDPTTPMRNNKKHPTKISSRQIQSDPIRKYQRKSGSIKTKTNTKTKSKTKEKGDTADGQLDETTKKLEKLAL